MNKIKILYIDDEVNNLNTFKANLRFEYDILTTNSIDQAYDILNKNQDIRIIFCDKRMPKKNGIDFFKDIREIYPNIVRILLTAYSDKEDIIEGINKCHIFKYLEKPMNFPEIRNVIELSNKYFISKINKNIESSSCKLSQYDKEQKNKYREDIATKLLVINCLIRNGYQQTIEKLGSSYNEYLLSIKDSNYYSLKHELLNEIKPLVI